MSTPRKRTFWQRLFRWMLGGVTAIVALLIITLAVIKSYDRPDETLSPLAQSMLKETRADVGDRYNGFVALMGVTAPSGKDMVEEGRHYIDRVTPIADRQEEAIPSFDDQWNGAALKWLGKLEPLCKESSSCWPANEKDIAHRQKEIAAFQQDNAELLGRVQQILVMPAFEPRGSLSFMMPSPPHEAISRFISLRREQAVVSAAQGDFSTALALLEMNQRDIRSLLKTHIATVATGMMNRDLLVVSAIINAPQLEASQFGERLANLLKPLTAEEREVTPELTYMFRRLVALMQQMQQLVDANFWARAWFWISPMFKPVATINQTAEQFDAMAGLAGMAPQQFLREQPRYHQQVVERYGRKKGGYADWDDVVHYNSAGESMLLTAVISSELMPREHFDLDAYLALLRAQWALRQADVSVGAVSAFLQVHNDTLADPWTNEPFSWDADRHALSFLLRGKSSTFASKDRAEVLVRGWE